MEIYYKIMNNYMVNYDYIRKKGFVLYKYGLVSV